MAERRGRAVNIDSSLYTYSAHVMSWDCTSVAWVRVALQGSTSVCLSACECVHVMLKCAEAIGMRNAKIAAWEHTKPITGELGP